MQDGLLIDVSVNKLLYLCSLKLSKGCLAVLPIQCALQPYPHYWYSVSEVLKSNFPKNCWQATV